MNFFRFVFCLILSCCLTFCSTEDEFEGDNNKSILLADTNDSFLRLSNANKIAILSRISDSVLRFAHADTGNIQHRTSSSKNNIDLTLKYLRDTIKLTESNAINIAGVLNNLLKLNGLSNWNGLKLTLISPDSLIYYFTKRDLDYIELARNMMYSFQLDLYSNKDISTYYRSSSSLPKFLKTIRQIDSLYGTPNQSEIGNLGISLSNKNDTTTSIVINMYHGSNNTLIKYNYQIARIDNKIIYWSVQEENSTN